MLAQTPRAVYSYRQSCDPTVMMVLVLDTTYAILSEAPESFLGEPMLLEPHSRFFLRHQLCFRTPWDHGVPLPFISGGKTLDVRSVLVTAIKANKAELVLKSQDVVRLTVLDVRPKQKIAVFLFRRSNPDAPAPVFEHIKTRKLRKSDKGPEEAPALSAHMFVRLGEIPDAAHPTYHAILEEVPGLSRTYIQLL